MSYKQFLPIAISAMVMSACGNKSLDISADDVSIAKFHDDKLAAISFTYDDGCLCHYEEMAPELEKRGFRATFWLTGANIGTDVPDYPYMTWEQVAELSVRGHEVSNHSWTHPHLTDLPVEVIKEEIAKCDSAILAATGKKPITFCYPYNAMSDTVVALASEGRVGTRTFWDAQGQEVTGCTDESLAQWLENTIADNKWSVTMTHATSHGWDKWEDPQVLWRLYDRVKEREDDVWVATFAEVAAYDAERNNTTLTVEDTSEGVTITPSCDLDPELFTQPLTLRINTGLNPDALDATQDGKSLTITKSGEGVLIDFLPSAGPIIITGK